MTTQALSLANIELTKFSIEEKYTTYSFRVPQANGIRTFDGVKDTRRPLPSLYEAAKKLGVVVAKLSEVTAEGVAFTGITVAQSDKREGWKLAGSKPYKQSHGKMNLNPPVRFESHSDAKQEYGVKDVKLIRAFLDECVAYIQGASTQGELFEQGDGMSEGEPEVTANPAPAAAE